MNILPARIPEGYTKGADQLTWPLSITFQSGIKKRLATDGLITFQNKNNNCQFHNSSPYYHKYSKQNAVEPAQNVWAQTPNPLHLLREFQSLEEKPYHCKQSSHRIVPCKTTVCFEQSTLNLLHIVYREESDCYQCRWKLRFLTQVMMKLVRG